MALEYRLKTVAAQEHRPTRWCLRRIFATCSDLVAVKTLMGLWKVLRRLGITRQQARLYVHSPDPLYAQKLAYIQAIMAQCDNQSRVLVFADELTYYNQPSVAPDYAPQKEQPKAPSAWGPARSYRIAGCLNPFDGQVTAIQRTKISIQAQLDLYTQLQHQYPQATTIYVVVDNWPIHFHPDVLAALMPQHTPFALVTPASWQGIKPKKKYQSMHLKIQLLPLPTYASWLNPIEKLWKYLKKELIHNHRYAHQMEELKRQLTTMLAELRTGSDALGSYCGLLNPEGIYAQALKINSAII